MRKLVIAVATVFATAAVVVGVAAASGDGGTVVARGFSCGLLDGNGGIFSTTNSTLTLYQTKAVLQCTGDGAAYTGPNPPKYFNFGNTGLACGMLEFGSTTDWRDKVGRSGNSQLTCVQHLNGDDLASSAGAGIG